MNITSANTVLFINGHIKTMDPTHAKAKNLLVRDGVIAGIDLNADDLEKLKKEKKLSTVDLQGKMLLPGFIESHGHLYGHGRTSTILSLDQAKSEEDILALVKEEVKDLPKGEWLLGRGWDQNKWHSKKLPTHFELSKLTPFNPVKLIRVDGHAAWYNQKALELAKLDLVKKDPSGGKIIRTSKGLPTGVLVDTAMDIVDEHIPNDSANKKEKILTQAMLSLAKMGITSFQDAGVNFATLDQLIKMEREGKLTIALYPMVAAQNFKDKDWQKLDQYKKIPEGPKGMLTIRCLKIFSDGALGSRGAALLAPYADAADNTGLILKGSTDIAQITKNALSRGFQVATHAIGDKANREVINGYELALNQVPSFVPPRLRIEHAQIVHPVDVLRLAKLDIIASMQPIHATSDMEWAKKRLGSDRFQERAYPWKYMQQKKVELVFGSDTPVEPANPLFGLYAAVYGADPKKETEGTFNPAQLLSLEEALQAYTINGAYAEFNEDKKGMLKKGYFADLIVLEHDLFERNKDNFLDNKVLMTMVRGEIVHNQMEKASHDT